MVLLLEVMYLWNAIPTCTKGDLDKMLEGQYLVLIITSIRAYLEHFRSK